MATPPIGPTKPIPLQVLTFRVYREGEPVESGIADVKLPDLSFMTEDIFGAGMTGKIKAVMPLIEAMTATLKWRTLHEDQFTLMQQMQQQGLILRVAQQNYDPGEGGPVLDGVAIRMKATGTKLGLGSVAPSSATDTDIELAVHYLKMTRNDGFVMCEADPVNQVLILNDEDQLAGLRELL